MPGTNSSVRARAVPDPAAEQPGHAPATAVLMRSAPCEPPLTATWAARGQLKAIRARAAARSVKIGDATPHRQPDAERAAGRSGKGGVNLRGEPGGKRARRHVLLVDDHRKAESAGGDRRGWKRSHQSPARHQPRPGAGVERSPSPPGGAEAPAKQNPSRLDGASVREVSVPVAARRLERRRSPGLVRYRAPSP
jgi:hypothetical protein